MPSGEAPNAGKSGWGIKPNSNTFVFVIN